MVALWMIGFEDQPERSAEICIWEIFGHDVSADHARVGMGLHPFGDPTIRDEIAQVELAMDPTEFHIYAAEWTPEYVAIFVDHQLVKLVEQSPTYPMQFMLGIYEFPTRGRHPIRRIPIPRSSPWTTSAGTGAPPGRSTPDSTLDVREWIPRRRP